MEGDSRNIRWYVGRAGNCQALSAKRKLEQWGVEHFVPTFKTMVIRNGRKKMVEKPLAGNLVFVRGTKLDVSNLINYRALPIHLIPDRCGNSSALVVPDKQMEDFMRVFEYSKADNESPEIILQTGDRVRVKCGELEGVEGEVIESPECTYVSVSLFGMLQARAKLPAFFLEKI